MKKNLVLRFLLIMLLLTSLSTGATEFNGFYTGISLGTAITTGSEQIVRRLSITGAGILSETLNHDQKNTKPLAALFAGYGFVCDPFYFGVEGFADWTRYRATTSLQNVQSFPGLGETGRNILINQTKLQNVEFGADLRPGWFIRATTLLFARIGVAYNKLSLQSSYSPTISDPGLGDNGSASLIIPNSKKRAAMRLGIGIEDEICSNLHLRADYIYTKYKNVRAASTLSIPAFSAYSDTSVKVSRNTVMIGLSYYW